MAGARKGIIGNVFDYHHVKNVVNRALWRNAGGDGRPVFFSDISAVSPALADLLRHADAIKAEFEAV